MEVWQANATIDLSNPRGLEVLVLTGSFSNEQDKFQRFSWLRLPAGINLRAKVGPDGAWIWYKSAPLLLERVCTP